MIRFGAWSTTLGLAAGFGALIAVLLLTASVNRSANRLLAALLAVATLRLMPYVIGYAGFYDAYPWLSFAPFDLGLATGPLLYLYVRRLATPALPPRWGWHFLPAALDFAYNAWAFALPIAAKERWHDDVHRPWIEPVEAAAALVSLGIYLGAAIRFSRRYRRWLAEHVSDHDVHRQPWIGTVLAALSLWLAVGVGFEIVDRFVRDLNYFDRFPQYLAFAAIVLWLGLEGWRHASHRFPPLSERVTLSAATRAAAAAASPETVPTPMEPARDWSALATQWLAEIEAAGWWREPGLTLEQVARRLGTNESYVSRAFNAGAGRNFNFAVNALRVHAVQQALASGDARGVLAIALECGFSSKASFNRVFLAHAGASPTAWKAAQIAEIRASSEI
ncbi:AraC family transcriptional regulator [Tahibacter sp.]|uniref:helix-turn-helix domain-containing protein n=1 Tax=Tahibacter sp. TaxID=2056211 RepID=UPI0028C3BE9C|nr:AraC family transcriptional regulator [Tahibacter sp.]